MAASYLVLLLCLASGALGQSPSTGFNKLVFTPIGLNPGVGDNTWISLLGAAGGLITEQVYPFVQTRTPFILAASGYEALAAYTPKGAGLFFGTKLKRPSSEQTDTNQRTAVLTTIYKTMVTLFGTEYLAAYPLIMKAAGLDPDDNSTDPTTPAGFGNMLGLKLAEIFLKDGANQLGDLPGKKYNRVPFSDYTGYEPVNTAYRLKDPTRWQPLRRLVGAGVTNIQEFTGAQGGSMKTYAMPKPSSCYLPPPQKSLKFPSEGYKKQAAEVLAASAALNDTTKMLAEVFDGGENWFWPLIFLSNKYNWDLEKQVKYQFALQLGYRDAAASIFYWKRNYDTVRPISAIRYSGIFKKVKAWGGPGKGTVTMDADEWRQYTQETAPEPEFPSGGSTLASVLAQTGSRYVGTNIFGWKAVVAKGASKIEPGITPKKELVFHFPYFTSWAEAGAVGRFVGGVHFADGVKAGTELGKCVTNYTFKKAQSLFAGET